MLKDHLSERFARNTIIETIGEEGQNKLFNSKILIAGAGGLGSIVISTLASLGIGNIGIIDNDKIELSNLNRQFIHSMENIGKSKALSAQMWVEKYNPHIKTDTYPVKLDTNNAGEILKNYDLIIDCFDSFDSKFLLNQACVKANKTMIHGGVLEFQGQVLTVIPGKSACLECIFPQYEDIEITQGVISPTVNVIGSLMAMEAAKIILDLKPVLTNSLLSYDGISSTFRKTNIKKDEECNNCKTN